MTIPENYHRVAGLSVHPALHAFVERELLPTARIEPAAFWDGLASIIRDLAPKHRELLAIRDAMQAKIDAWFAHDRMQDIVAALQADGSELALATLKTLNEKSPRGMVVTLKLLRLARTAKSLEECLVREYRAALQVFASDDFREGVRAAVIDKDRRPKWSPPRIEDVTPAMVAPYFAEIGADELKFP